VHGVIERPAHPVDAGDSARITLRLGGGRTIEAVARVVAYTALDSALSPAGAPGEATAAAPLDGGALYRANGCVSCHGRDGHGDGPIAVTLDPRPRDFRDAIAFRQGIDTAAIAQTLASGIVGGGSMPRYAHLTLAERRAIAGYLISLRSPIPDTTDTP
jgi:mono/diheme cytochrome c family protein